MTNDNIEPLYICAEHLTERLRTKEIKQTVLARLLGIADSTVSSWVNPPTEKSLHIHPVSNEHLEKMCLYLDCMPDYLLGRSDKPYLAASGNVLTVSFSHYNKELNSLLD